MRRRTVPAVLSLALAAARAGAQVDPIAAEYTNMSPGQVFAGACTGSGAGTSQPSFAGRDPIRTGMYTDQRTRCDAHLGTGYQSAVQTHFVQTLNAQASGELGTLRVGADMTLLNQWQASDPTLFLPRSRGVAGFVDELTIDAPLYTGQPGIFEFELHVDGELDGNGAAGVAGFFINRFVGTSQTATAIVSLILGETSNPAEIDQTVLATVPFVYGTPFKFGLFSGAGASTARQTFGPPGNAPSNAYSYFQNTIEWMGITGVRTAGGQAVTVWSVTTASGDDWVLGPQATVPEPATWALTAGGLAVLGIAARRRRAG